MSFFARHICGRSRLLLLSAAVLTVVAHTVSAQPRQNYTGDGGKGMSLTVYVPQSTGLSKEQSYIPALVQGEFVSNFSNYSAISILDWERLDDIYVKLVNEAYDDKAAAKQDVVLGRLAPTSHFLTGSITKTATGYNIKMNITATADKMTVATYSGTFTFAELDNLTGVRRASLELLQKVGVELTEAARHELAGAAAANQVSAQTALAKGVTAQRAGTEVAALSYFYQAASFDPSLFEAANRSKVTAANISSGNIGNDIRNEIAWRQSWKDRLAETEETFYNIIKSSDPPYTLFYSTGIDKEKIHYEEKTADLSVPINLVANWSWFKAMDRSLLAVQAVLNGLNRTKKKEDWGLDGWPWRGVTQTNPFDKWKRYDIVIVFELVNQQGRVIGSQTVRLTPSFKITSDDNRLFVSFEDNTAGTVVFGEVRTEEITEKLTIRVASVNGKPPQSARFAINAISDETREEYLVWEIEKGVVTGFSDDNKTRYNLIIPSEVWGQPIIGIRDGAFAKRGLSSVAIQDGVTSIGKRAFADNRLISVTIPSSVTAIGEWAFFANDRLSEITINAKNVTIGKDALPDSFMTFYYNAGRRTGTYYSYHKGGGVTVWGNTAEITQLRADDERERARKIAEDDSIKVEYERARARRIAEDDSIKAEYEREVARRRAEADSSRAEAERKKKAEIKRLETRMIRFGGCLNGSLLVTSRGTSSEWFNTNYSGYDDLGRADWDVGGSLGAGLMLNIRISKNVALATELNYAYQWTDAQYGATRNAETKKVSDVMEITISNHTMNVPILLRIGGNARGDGEYVIVRYFEVGYIFGFPMSSEIGVTSGSKFQYDEIKDRKDYSEFRTKKDEGIVIGFCVGSSAGSSGDVSFLGAVLDFRFVYSLTKWYNDGGFKTPLMMGVTLGRHIF